MGHDLHRDPELGQARRLIPLEPTVRLVVPEGGLVVVNSSCATADGSTKRSSRSFQANDADGRCEPVPCYGVYTSAVAEGALPHPLGLQLASLSPPTLRACPVASRTTAALPTAESTIGPVAVHVPVAGE
jgi:hypothetical protein